MAVALAGILVALLVAPQAALGQATPDRFPDDVSSGRVQVDYNAAGRGPATADDIGDGQARALAADANDVISRISDRFGFPAPLADTDGKVHVYVYAFSGAAREGGAFARTRQPEAETSAGYVGMRPDRIGSRIALTHVLFHLAQSALWQGDGFLHEASATWAARELEPDDPESLAMELTPAAPLDCIEGRGCPRAGYRAWPFLAHLAERHRRGVVRAAYDHLRAGAQPLDALDRALQERGVTLASAFRTYAHASLSGAFGHPELAGLRYGGALPEADTVATGPRTRRLRTRRLALDHLSMRFLQLSGSGTRRGRRCRRAQLSVRVTAGRARDLRLAYTRGAGRRARELRLRRGRARLVLPWSTCPRSRVGLVVANADPREDRRGVQLRSWIRVR